MWAAQNGHVDAMRVMLDHPSADPAAMMMYASNSGSTAFMLAARNGHVDAVRALLDHPSADPAAMMMYPDNNCWIALMAAATHAGVMHMMLNHPSADPAAMLAFRTPTGASALTAAAGFAVGSSPNHRYAPLLLLLRRVDLGPQPCAAKEAHMPKVLETCHVNQKALLNVDQPDDSRDEPPTGSCQASSKPTVHCGKAL
ncbi:hypothetical protein FOA52_014615 [Chlamydomonas sp. UWO 241]|nr:hypothetical protein FOA52_014615 [Chlamydomonas sp. UWO 241]